MPVLTETPPAPDIDGLRALRSLDRSGARIQVAEQYQFQPLHAARLALAASGRLGTVSQAQMSVAHGYHGIDLMRRYLALDDDAPVTIRGMRFRSPIVDGPDRDGPPHRGARSCQSEQTIAWFDFGERLGVMDFTDDQYFSWIRYPAPARPRRPGRDRRQHGPLSRDVRHTRDAAAACAMTRARRATWKGTT